LVELDQLQVKYHNNLELNTGEEKDPGKQLQVKLKERGELGVLRHR